MSTSSEKLTCFEQFTADFKSKVFDILVRSIVLCTFHSKLIIEKGMICQFYDLDTVASIKWKILERALTLFPECTDAREMANIITTNTNEFVTFSSEDLDEWQCLYEQYLISIKQ